MLASSESAMPAGMPAALQACLTGAGQWSFAKQLLIASQRLAILARMSRVVWDTALSAHNQSTHRSVKLKLQQREGPELSDYQLLSNLDDARLLKSQT